MAADFNSVNVKHSSQSVQLHMTSVKHLIGSEGETQGRSVRLEVDFVQLIKPFIAVGGGLGISGDITFSSPKINTPHIPLNMTQWLDNP